MLSVQVHACVRISLPLFLIVCHQMGICKHNFHHARVFHVLVAHLISNPIYKICSCKLCLLRYELLLEKREDCHRKTYEHHITHTVTCCFADISNTSGFGVVNRSNGSLIFVTLNDGDLAETFVDKHIHGAGGHPFVVEM